MEKRRPIRPAPQHPPGRRPSTVRIFSLTLIKPRPPVAPPRAPPPNLCGMTPLAANDFSPKMPPMANGKQKLELTWIGKENTPWFRCGHGAMGRDQRWRLYGGISHADDRLPYRENGLWNVVAGRPTRIVVDRVGRTDRPHRAAHAAPSVRRFLLRGLPAAGSRHREPYESSIDIRRASFARR